MKLIFAISIVALSFFGTACRRSVGEMILVPMPQEATFTGGYFETDSARSWSVQAMGTLPAESILRLRRFVRRVTG